MHSQPVLRATRARSKGLELEVDYRPAEHVGVHLGAGYNDATITEGAVGSSATPRERLLDTPNWMSNLSFSWDFVHANQYVADAEVTWNYVGDSFSSFNQSDPTQRRPAYATAHLRIGLRHKNWQINLAGRNLGNKLAQLSLIEPLSLATPGRDRIVALRPRTIGLTARWDW